MRAARLTRVPHWLHFRLSADISAAPCAVATTERFVEICHSKDASNGDEAFAEHFGSLGNADTRGSRVPRRPSNGAALRLRAGSRGRGPCRRRRRRAQGPAAEPKNGFFRGGLLATLHAPPPVRMRARMIRGPGLGASRDAGRACASARAWRLEARGRRLAAGRSLRRVESSGTLT